MALADRGDNVIAFLASEPRLQSGDISFVTHSFGGLVVKQILRSAESKASASSAIANILRHTRRVVFLATPHQGADLAGWGDKLRVFFRPSAATAGLIRNDPNLRNLNLWYRGFSTQNGIQNVTLVETQKTGWFGHVVKPDSADAGLASDPVPIDADHDAICAPASRGSQVYTLIRDFLQTPTTGTHRDTLLADALQKNVQSIDALGAASANQNQEVINRLDILIASDTAAHSRAPCACPSNWLAHGGASRFDGPHEPFVQLSGPD
jgi:hypothetical protein